MASRPNRAAPIPIPMPPSGVRSLDNAISIPHRFPSSSSFATSPPSLVRSVPRASLSSSRGSPRVPYEPRIVRASHPATADRCLQPPVSTTHARRASTSPHQARSATRSSANTQADAPPLVVTTDTFPRPAYLDHSTFRDLLHTDPSCSSLRRDASTLARTTPASSVASTMTPSTDSDDDHSTPPRRTVATTPLPAPLQPQAVFSLPTRWSVTDRSNHLTISQDGRDLTYTGNGDKDGASARTDIPIPPACGIYYYEVEIRGKDQKSHVSIGFAGPKVKFNRLPGWEPFSWGYHGDDGFSFTAERTGNPYAQTYGSGDIIGCGVDFSTHRGFYTKNGLLLGNVFENVGKGIDLYPSVGLQHSGESIRVNFGHEPFKFDIENHVQQQKSVAWNKIMATPLYTSILNPGSSTSASKAALSEEESKIVLGKLVLSYLIHHGYSKTVRAFQKQQDIVLKTKPATADDGDVDMDSDPMKQSAVGDSLEDDIERRTRVVDAVVRGDIDLAITETEKYHPDVLKAEEGLMLFKLRCRKFVELILETAAMKKHLDAVKERQERPVFAPSFPDGDGPEENMDMDIDDDQSRETSASQADATPKNIGKQRAGSGSISAAQYEAAINAAIKYGKALETDYQGDTRPGVKQLLKQTFAIIAFHDPLGQRGEMANFVSADARAQLASELNQAILKSQGQPAQPDLETCYRHTSACITQLGIFGEGAAGFADLQRELLES